MGEQILPARSGAFVHLPKGIPHAFQNIGATIGRLLLFVTPPGLEHFFREQSRLHASGETKTERIARIAQRYGIQYTAQESGCTPAA